MTQIIIVGYGPETEKIKLQITHWIKTAVEKFPGDAVWEMIRDHTRIVSCPTSAAETLYGGTEPYVAVSATGPKEADAVHAVLKDIVDPPLNLLLGPSLTRYTPAKKT